MLVNVDGEAFMHPLETRDVCFSKYIRECSDDRNVALRFHRARLYGWILQ